MTVNNTNPLISIIVPVYNSEKYLHRCVNSIIAQTYWNLEIILVDDGSTDKSSQICDDYKIQDSRIRVIHKTNGGLSSARNEGLNNCHGDYIGFVDSDDWIENDMYEELLRTVKNRNKSIGQICVSCDSEDGNIISSSGGVTGNEIIYSKETYLENILIGKAGGAVWNKLFSKKIIDDRRFIQEKLNEDVMFLLDIYDNFEDLALVDKIGYHYIQRKASISHVFGKSRYDAVSNAEHICRVVLAKVPALEKQAQKYEILQNLLFLRFYPYKKKCIVDETYLKCEEILRKKYFIGLTNRYLSLKEKMCMTLLVICPRVYYLINKNR